LAILCSLWWKQKPFHINGTPDDIVLIQSHCRFGLIQYSAIPALRIHYYLWPNFWKWIQIIHSYLIILHEQYRTFQDMDFRTEILKKYSGNTTALYKIPLNTQRNTLNYMCDLEPLPKIWSHLSLSPWGIIFTLAS